MVCPIILKSNVFFLEKNVTFSTKGIPRIGPRMYHYTTHTQHTTHNKIFLQHTEKVTFLHGLFFLSVFGVFCCLFFLYLSLCVLKMGCVCVLMLFLCFCFVLFFEKRKGRKGREGRKEGCVKNLLICTKNSLLSLKAKFSN